MLLAVLSNFIAVAFLVVLFTVGVKGLAGLWLALLLPSMAIAEMLMEGLKHSSGLTDQAEYIRLLSHPYTMDFTATVAAASIWLVGYRIIEVVRSPAYASHGALAAVGAAAWTVSTALTCYRVRRHCTHNSDDSNASNDSDHSTATIVRYGTLPLTAATTVVHLIVAAVLLALHLPGGEFYGPSLYFCTVQIVLLGLALLFRRGTINQPVSVLQWGHLIAAVLMALVSLFSSFLVLGTNSHHEGRAIFGALFANVPLILLIAFLLLTSNDTNAASDGEDCTNQQHVKKGLCTSLSMLLLALPGVELCFPFAPVLFTLLAAVIGLAAVGTSLRWSGLPESHTVHITTGHCRGAYMLSPTLLFWGGMMDLFLVIAASFVRGFGEFFEGSLIWMLIVVRGGTFAVVRGGDGCGDGGGGGGGGGGGSGGTNSTHTTVLAQAGRLVQFIAATLFLIPFFVWPLTSTHDYGVAVLLLLGGGTILIVSVYQRHRDVVFLTASVLVVGFWIQFFVKLHRKVPLAVPLISFGVAMLMFTVFYERRLKHTTSLVRRWHGSFESGLHDGLLPVGGNQSTAVNAIGASATDTEGFLTTTIELPNRMTHL
jgi:hypothetical protein